MNEQELDANDRKNWLLTYTCTSLCIHPQPAIQSMQRKSMVSSSKVGANFAMWPGPRDPHPWRQRIHSCSPHSAKTRDQQIRHIRALCYGQEDATLYTCTLAREHHGKMSKMTHRNTPEQTPSWPANTCRLPGAQKQWHIVTAGTSWRGSGL